MKRSNQFPRPYSLPFITKALYVAVPVAVMSATVAIFRYALFLLG